MNTDGTVSTCFRCGQEVGPGIDHCCRPQTATAAAVGDERELARLHIIEQRARDVVVNVDSTGIVIANRPGQRVVHDAYIEALRAALNSVP